MDDDVVTSPPLVVPAAASDEPVPGAAAPTRPPDFGQWVRLYPLYFNANVSKAKGREVPKDLATPDPTPQLLLRAVMNSGLDLKFVFEPKVHPAEYLKQKGAVRVQLYDPDSSPRKPLNAGVPTKTALLKAVALALLDVAQPDPEAAGAAAAAPAPAPSTKGKKK